MTTNEKSNEETAEEEVVMVDGETLVNSLNNILAELSAGVAIVVLWMSLYVSQNCPEHHKEVQEELNNIMANRHGKDNIQGVDIERVIEVVKALRSKDSE